jgi:hypothetical protein
MRNACSLPSSRARAAVASVTARSVCSRWSYRSARWTRSSALDDSKPHICAGFFDLDEAGLPDGASLDAGAWTPYLNGIGFGSFLLAYSDAVLDAIDTSCTGENLKHYDAGLGHVDAGVLALLRAVRRVRHVGGALVPGCASGAFGGGRRGDPRRVRARRFGSRGLGRDPRDRAQPPESAPPSPTFGRLFRHGEAGKLRLVRRSPG